MDAEKTAMEIACREKEIVRLLAELVSKKTVNPPGNESLAAEALEKYFKKHGIKCRKFEKGKGRTSLVASIGKGRPELMIALHSDVVPAGGGWKTEPFRAVQKKGKIFGRGTADNKGPLAASAVFLSAMKKHEKELKGTISVLAAADEERGSRLGTAFLLKENKIKPDFVVVPDIFTENRKISVAEKGLLHIKAEAFGKQAHGSEPEKGENAILKLGAFLCELRKMKMPPAKSRHLKNATMNIGTINGGEAINIVPAYCEAKIDIRFVPGQDPCKIFGHIRKIAKKHGANVSAIDCQMPFEISGGIPLVKSIERSAKKITGKKPSLAGMAGTTVAKKFLEKGIPAIGFGPGKMVAHESNEYIEVRQLVEFAQIMAIVSGELLA
ncbi:MAG: ArgE/DapE family deacylase [Candidatus Diapherotrites archaeon]|nr:ArgE/DapE family deacylase [Candidatus Diapherotrites archaeon]